jgi:hypothetical protein
MVWELCTEGLKLREEWRIADGPFHSENAMALMYYEDDKALARQLLKNHFEDCSHCKYARSSFHILKRMRYRLLQSFRKRPVCL